ncbi:MAG: AAA family ATPase [Candidatus Hodarchaeales archaeon]
MKIEKAQIRNFCSLKDVTIFPKNILAIIGRNNSGKSNIIKALDLFFHPSIKKVNEECFFNKKTEDPIEIIITFNKLSDWEKDKFKNWIDEDKLRIGREVVFANDSVKINHLAFKTVPEVEWLQEDEIKGKNIEEWWKNKEKLVVGEVHFKEKLGTSKLNVGEWKDIVKRFTEENKDEIRWIKKRNKNPKGYSGVLSGALPEFIYVPAVRDVSDEAKVTKTNPFGQLLNSVLDKISEAHIEDLSERIKEIEKLLNRSGGKERIEGIGKIEGQLSKLMSEIMDCDIEIEMNVPELRTVFGGARIFVNDGIRTAIETKGHGLQRSMIFTILRAYAELTHKKKAEERAGERSTIFTIEEPEIYLHPQAQRTFMSVFRDIASNNDQVIYSTQSSLFVDIKHFDEICIMRREKRGPSYESYAFQLPISRLLDDLKARKGVEGTKESICELYSHAFNPVVNEGFFADKVVIVEGLSEQYSLPIYAASVGYDCDRANVAVVNLDGKD